MLPSASIVAMLANTEPVKKTKPQRLQDTVHDLPVYELSIIHTEHL